MEASHQAHAHDHEQGHHDDLGQHDDHGHADHEDWNDEDFVARWLGEQSKQAAERRRQFVTMRAFMPKLPEQEFRYLNLGAGPGELDKVLLEHFPGANATLVDTSLAMLGAARKQLGAFGSRVEYVQANLSSAGWTGAVSGPFDFVVSTLALHHLPGPRRIRDLYSEVLGLLGHGGMFLNLDYIRPARPGLAPLADWAARDHEAGFSARSGMDDLAGSLSEHLGWLSEAGFPNVEVLWKDMSLALIMGIRDHLHLPEGHAHDAGHAHSH